MKIKILLVIIIASGAIISMASTQVLKKDKVKNTHASVKSEGGFVSEEI